MNREIIDLLKVHSEGLTAIDIAIALGKEKAKDVNPDIYKLSMAKLIIRTESPDSKKPIWFFNINVNEVTQLLEDHPDGLSPTDIAKILGKGKAKDVNPLLYGMASSGLLVKKSEADGTKPLWSNVKLTEL